MILSANVHNLIGTLFETMVTYHFTYTVLMLQKKV